MRKKLENLLKNRAINLSIQVTKQRLKNAGVTLDSDLGLELPKVKYRFSEVLCKSLAR